MTKNPKSVKYDENSFYAGYVSESHNGNAIRVLEEEADKIAEEIDSIEFDMEEDESFNHNDVVRLPQLRKRLEELEDKIVLLENE